MNKRIEIQLILRPDCKLIAVDNEDYSNWGLNLEKYQSVEFLVYNDSDNIIPETLQIKYSRHSRDYFSWIHATEFILKKDGTYAYYKMIIPKLDLFESAETTYSNLYQQLYYDNNQLYFSTLEDDNEYTYEEVKTNRIEINDYLEAYKIINSNQALQSLYCPAKYIFSVCKLQRCLVSLQKKFIINRCVSNSCEEDKNLKNKRDFLLSAVYAFDYLKDIGNFSEAQRILENLYTCDNICEVDLINTYNDCNCGDTI